MPKNKTSKDHADRNFAVCEFLNDKTKYFDWIVTISFYSAYHYVLYRLFPLKFPYKGKTLTAQNFDSYCNLKGDTNGKHAQVSFLIEKNCKSIAPDYNKLKDLSWSARYIDYGVDNPMAEEARRLMKKIKKYCSP